MGNLEQLTGAKLTVLRLGLKDVALTFNLCAEVGLRGWEALAGNLLLLSAEFFLPLKGGIAWITMLILDVLAEEETLLLALPLGTGVSIVVHRLQRTTVTYIQSIMRRSS